MDGKYLECRHSFASLMIAAGENPKAIQTFMGHATIQMTFDRYGHLIPAAATRPAPGWTLTWPMPRPRR
jgi:integrase